MTIENASESIEPRKYVAISPYPNVGQRAEELGLMLGDGITILPRHFDDAASAEDVLHEDESPDVVKLLHRNNLSCQECTRAGGSIPYIHEHAFEWIGPTLFVAREFLASNPGLLIQIVRLLYDFLRSSTSRSAEPRRVSFRIVSETSEGRARCMEYDGPMDGLSKMEDIIRTLKDED